MHRHNKRKLNIGLTFIVTLCLSQICFGQVASVSTDRIHLGQINKEKLVNDQYIKLLAMIYSLPQYVREEYWPKRKLSEYITKGSAIIFGGSSAFSGTRQLMRSSWQAGVVEGDEITVVSADGTPVRTKLTADGAKIVRKRAFKTAGVGISSLGVALGAFYIVRKDFDKNTTNLDKMIDDAFADNLDQISHILELTEDEKIMVRKALRQVIIENAKRTSKDYIEIVPLDIIYKLGVGNPILLEGLKRLNLELIKNLQGMTQEQIDEYLANQTGSKEQTLKEMNSLLSTFEVVMKSGEIAYYRRFYNTYMQLKNSTSLVTAVVEQK